MQDLEKYMFCDIDDAEDTIKDLMKDGWDINIKVFSSGKSIESTATKDGEETKYISYQKFEG